MESALEYIIRKKEMLKEEIPVLYPDYKTFGIDVGISTVGIQNPTAPHAVHAHYCILIRHPQPLPDTYTLLRYYHDVPVYWKYTGTL